MWNQLKKRGAPLTSGRTSSQKRNYRKERYLKMIRVQYIEYQRKLQEEKKNEHIDRCKKLNLPITTTPDECKNLEEIKIKIEQENLEKEILEIRLENERLENERLENERLEKIRLENERLEKIRLENERLEKIRLENERLEKIRLENERLVEMEKEREKIKKLKLELERAKAESKKQKKRLEKERMEREIVEKERVERERVEKERAEREREILKKKNNEYMKMLFKPTSTLGTKIFIFNGETPNLRNASVYGKKYIDQVIKHFPNTEIIWSSMVNSDYSQLPEIYNQVAVGLCLTEQKHEVAGLKEMNLMNIPIIHNHSTFGLKWKNVDDIIMHLMKTKNISRQIKASYFNGINIETSINNTNKKFDTLTIIINSYNPHPPDLYKSLASCFSQKKINIKIIISTVENDPTIKIVNNLKNNKFNTLRDTMTRDIKLVICKLSEHPGRGPRGIFFQLNKALEEVKTRYVSYFSSNDIMLSTKSYNEIERIKNDNSIFCFSRYNSYYPLTKNTERFNYPKNLMNYSNLLKSNFINDCATIDLNQLTEPLQFNYEKYGNTSYWHLWLKLLNKHGEKCMSINDNVEWVYIRDEHKSQAIKRKQNKNKMQLYWNQREFMLSEFDVNIKPKSIYRYDNANEKFWWWNDPNNKKPVEMTVALPALNARKIIWLALESLKNQININFAWELIVFEEEGISKKIVQSYKGLLPGCVRIIYKIITKEDALYKIEDIKKNKCTSYYTLLEKWINMAKIADNNSKIFVKHAVDCYSSPKRLYIHYEHFKNDMCYYSTQPKGYFYNINQDKWLLYNGYKLEPIKWNEYGERKLKYLNDNFKDDKNIKVRGCHLNMATRTELVKKLSFSKNPLRSGIDSYLLSEICKIIKKRPEEEKIIFTDDEIDKDNWKYSLDTDGNNNISHFRKDLYTKNTYDFFKIIEKKNNECCIDSYIISYLRIKYLKNTNEILNINKKLLINEKKLDNKLKSIIDNLKLDYDLFKSYENQNLEKYFLVIDDNYDNNLYKKTIESKIYYSCNKSGNNHILKNIDNDILKKLIFRIKCIEENYINNVFELMNNSKILFVSVWDYGFSMYNMYLSLKKINPNIQYFNFNIKYRNEKMKQNYKNSIDSLKNININDFDILIFKDDHNINGIQKWKNIDNILEYSYLYKFLNSEILKINVVTGSNYRNSFLIPIAAKNKIPIYDKIIDFDFVFSISHDLCYYFDTKYFGHKYINSNENYYIETKKYLNKKIYNIGTSPTNREKKGTDIIINAVKKIQEMYKDKLVINLILLENLSQNEVIFKKKNLDLFIDQLLVGGYGSSLIEAMIFGVPCFVNFNENNFPIINIDSNLDNLVNKIDWFINLKKGEKKILSDEVFNYYHKFHVFKNRELSICDFYNKYKFNCFKNILSLYGNFSTKSNYNTFDLTKKKVMFISNEIIYNQNCGNFMWTHGFLNILLNYYKKINLSIVQCNEYNIESRKNILLDNDLFKDKLNIIDLFNKDNFFYYGNNENNNIRRVKEDYIINFILNSFKNYDYIIIRGITLTQNLIEYKDFKKIYLHKLIYIDVDRVNELAYKYKLFNSINMTFQRYFELKDFKNEYIIPPLSSVNYQIKNIPFHKKKYDFCIVGTFSYNSNLENILNKFINIEYNIFLIGKSRYPSQYFNDLKNKYSSYNNIIFNIKDEGVSAQECIDIIIDSKFGIRFDKPVECLSSKVLNYISYKTIPIIQNIKTHEYILSSDYPFFIDKYDITCNQLSTILKNLDDKNKIDKAIFLIDKAIEKLNMKNLLENNLKF